MRIEFIRFLTVKTPYLFYYLSGYYFAKYFRNERVAVFLTAIGALGTTIMPLIALKMPSVSVNPENFS